MELKTGAFFSAREKYFFSERQSANQQKDTTGIISGCRFTFQWGLKAIT
jgi:hypothetical protein